MILAPWRLPLSHALHRNRSLPYSRYFQLATVTSEGLPANRTVVFRGFLDNTNQLQIITDARSEKINHINHQPWGEVCWYFPKTREQLRLRGKLTLIEAHCTDEQLQAARLKAWLNLSDATLLQFSWPTPKQSFTDAVDFSLTKVTKDKPLTTFCLILLNPEIVDHLELGGEQQNRYIYTLDISQQWSMEKVNP